MQVALLAEDATGPTLTPTGMVHQATVGRVDNFGGPTMTNWLKRDIIDATLPTFIVTGWLQEVPGPENDGTYQLNLTRLKRLLDQAEATLATGQSDQEALEQADRELPGDFDSAPDDLAEQVDRILVSNPAM
ncbi:hypothetical protein [Corynebacterium riegelii]|uniref:hypothetical protein n=1 Tax=Corynebacterium riegelii TaxID=156976 RepID=UPI0023EFF17F|nr:hypothetical protein [Corynebacterium riegelii]